MARASAIRNAQAQLVELARQGAPSAVLRRAERKIATLEEERGGLVERRLGERRAVDGLANTVATVSAFESAVSDLDGRVPIALLPVRIETRFAADRKTLRVRIFPDAIHQDGHEHELTADEAAAAVRYWTTRWEKGGVGRDRAAWRDLARPYRPTRARWLVEVMTPSNVAALGVGDPIFPTPAQRPEPWTRAPIARGLPERWCVVAYRGGTEVVRKWGQRVPDDLPMGLAPDATAVDDPAAEPMANQDALPIDDEMQWVVDYDVAVSKGMAVSIDEADVVGGQLADGFDLLMVVGVDWTRKPAATAAELESHLSAHMYSDGLSFLAVGTPTNVTSEDAAPPAADVAGHPEPLDPTTSAAITQDSNATRLRDALGLQGPSVLETAPGGPGRLDTAAQHMNSALWAPTWGYFLDQIMRPAVSVTTADYARDHFRRYVRGRGPLPTLRIGKQPYGVLPVMAPANWKPLQAGLEGDLARRVSDLRALWTQSSAAGPWLVNHPSPDEALIELLRHTPRSQTFRFRKVTGPTVASGLEGLDKATQFQESVARLFLTLVGIDGTPNVAHLTLADTTQRLHVPFVTPGVLSEVDELEPNYFRSLLVQLSASGGFKRLVEDPATASSLLEALLRHAAQLEMTRAAFRLIADAEVEASMSVQGNVLPKETEIHGAPISELRPIARTNRRAEGGTVLGGSDTVLELALRPVGLVSGRRTVANHVASQSNAELRSKVATRRFAEFRASLDHLSSVPPAELGRLAAETLDCSSHRLDAWVTSLATRRLSELRALDHHGIHIGGYGWVEDIRLQGAPTSLGYTLAPSVGQASTAAILRSGHLSRRTSGDSVLAIDLSSARVSLALEILDGVRQGQPIGAILGYRFERHLRERSLSLAKYILDFRRAAPLDTATDGFDDSHPLEAIAARDVVDGVKLVRRTQEAATALLDEVGVEAGDRDIVRGELGRLAEALDAVSDVLMSESVYQAVLGNPERSGAALDAIDRQTLMPDVSVVRTPRTGHGLSHRLMMVLADDTLPDSWSGRNDPRAAAEPRLNAWIARAIGRPDSVRITAVAKDADGKKLNPPLHTRLSELELSPMSTMLAAVGGGAGRATELEERLADHFSRLEPDGTVSLEFRPDPPAGSPKSVLGLAELIDLCGRLADLLESCRHGSARDLAGTIDRVDDGFDRAELRRRADAAVTSLRRATGNLPNDSENPSVPRLRRALLAMADVGLRGAVPASVSRDELIAQAAQVAARAGELLDQMDAVERDLDRSTASTSVQVQHDLARLRMIFGEHYPVAPLIRATNADELAASLAARDRLLAGDSLAPTLWLLQHSLVRPAVGRLCGTLTDSEMRGRDVGADQLAVVQLPHRIGDRWVGLPLAQDTPLHVGATSLVIHAPNRVDVKAPFAVWVVDQWSEVIPSKTETAGIGFHFDAPGSRAPQSILLAVPPDLTATGWSVAEMIRSVREAVELSMMRTVDLDSLEAVGRFLPAIYLAFNLERKTPSLDLWEVANHGVELQNKAFDEGGGG